jgi:protein phosphatase
MKAGVATDIGLVRNINQDSYYCSAVTGSLFLYIVADGMGGHNGGEIASKTSVETIRCFIETHQDKTGYLEDRLYMIKEAMSRANREVYSHAMSTEGLEGMGTTLTMALIEGKKLHIGHIGDSRMYLMRNGECEKLTEDHSLVAELIKKGSISPEEGDKHPQKNIITKALGTDRLVEMDLLTKDLRDGDLILLCTDGLTNMLDLDDIVSMCRVEDNPQSLSEALVEKANSKGGRDNITVIAVKVGWDK